MIERPSDIIHHIVGEELEKGHGVIDTTTDLNGDTGLVRARNNHPDWKMAFTVNKKINSKKLIEGIAKETKLFPFLKGDKLSFNSIKDTYAENDEDFLINDSDVMSIKFDRTKIEDIKTKVRLDYHYDYATDEYLESTTSLDIFQTAFDFFEDAENPELQYSNTYYGIPEDKEVGDDIIEVKYIRHQGDVQSPYDETIAKLHQFLLAWYCNQHNTCKIKLPLSFLFAEVGDITAFPETINERLTYGEDYSLNAGQVIRNGQEIYPYWVVMGVNKTLEYVELDLIQLHNLTSATTNLAPIAIATANPSFGQFEDEIMLIGQNSYDPPNHSPDSPGGIESYQWTQAGGTAVTLSSDTDMNPTFELPMNHQGEPEELSFQLVVNDGEYDSQPSDLLIVTNNTILDQIIRLFSHTDTELNNPSNALVINLSTENDFQSSCFVQNISAGDEWTTEVIHDINSGYGGLSINPTSSEDYLVEMSISGFAPHETARFWVNFYGDDGEFRAFLLVSIFSESAP